MLDLGSCDIANAWLVSWKHVISISQNLRTWVLFVILDLSITSLRFMQVSEVELSSWEYAELQRECWENAKIMDCTDWLSHWINDIMLKFESKGICWDWGYALLLSYWLICTLLLRLYWAIISHLRLCTHLLIFKNAWSNVIMRHSCEDDELATRFLLYVLHLHGAVKFLQVIVVQFGLISRQFFVDL